MKRILRYHPHGKASPSTFTTHMGRLSHQVKLNREETSPRISQGTAHLSAKNAQELERTPGNQEEGHGSPNRPPEV
jgi:hypothetical protein